MAMGVTAGMVSAGCKRYLGMSKRQSRAISRQRPSGLCPKCGTYRQVLHRDHVIPKWKGGLDEPSNWQYLCANCHEDKSIAESRSEEAREKRRRDHVGKKRSPETCAKLAALMLGKKHSAETKAKIGAKSRGRRWVMSPEGRANVSRAKLRQYQAAREAIQLD